MRSPLVRVTVGVLAVSLGTLSLAGCGSDKAATTSATALNAASATDATGKASDSLTVVGNSAAGPADTVGTLKPATKPNIVFTAVGAGAFLTLAKLLATADLLATLKGPGPFTVFAPTDDAFAAVPAKTLAGVAADAAKLKKVLLYHVVPGALKTSDIKDGDLMTVEGSVLKITHNGDKLLINGNPIAAADVEGSNGVVNIMGNVLLPPDL